MATMTTVLEERSSNGNVTVWTVPANHTLQKQFMVKHTSRLPDPSKGQVVAEDVVSIYATTVDAQGATLPQKAAISVSVKRPITGIAADMTAVLAVARDIMASDEFSGVVDNADRLS
jgi:hypothetical protein